MPKQPLQEIFSQGLVTSRPSHMLSSGELVRADHTVYRENNVALQRAPDHGYYCQTDLSGLFAGERSCTGIVSANFEAADNPDQLILRVGSDLLSSSILGASNNTVTPVTFPSRLIGDFDDTPYVNNVVFSTATNIITPPSTGAFDSFALVGRAICSSTAYPRTTTYIITNVVWSGGHVTAIHINEKPLVNVTQGMYFAPKFTPSLAKFYSESVGFKVIPSLIGDISSQQATVGFTSGSNVVTLPITGWRRPPIGSLSQLNYAQVGRTVYSDHLTPSNATITSVTYSEDDPDLVISFTVDSTSATTGNGSIIFTVSIDACFITAVGGEYEAGENPAYNSCYFNLFPPAGTYALTFTGGVGRRYPDKGHKYFDGLSWDGTMFLWDGANPVQRLEYRNRVSYDPAVSYPAALVSRPAGLRPVSKPFSVRRVELEVAGNAWNRSMKPGVYWFLVTEAYIPSKNQIGYKAVLANDLLESAYLAADTNPTAGTGGVVNADGGATSIGRPIPINITDVTKEYVELTLPAPVNDGTDGYVATHWCVYMAGVGEDMTVPPPFTAFHRTAVVSFTQYTAGQKIVLRDSQLVQRLDAQTTPLAVPGHKPILVYPNGLDVYTQVFDEETGDPTGEYIHSWTGEVTYEMMSGKNDEAREHYQAWGDFTFISDEAGHPDIGTGSYAGLDIAGIQVNIRAGSVVSRVADYNVSLRTLTQVGDGPHYFTIDNERYDTNVIGGPNEIWGFDRKTVSKSTLRVRVDKPFSNTHQMVRFFKPQLVIFWTGTTVNLNGPIYRCVTYRSQVGAADISDPTHLPPPVASLADTFQGSLVCNDMSAPSFIRYSLPDMPEQFPNPYRMRMGTKRKGKITALKAYKQILIVGMERAIKRLNYLPKETDTDFSQGVGLSHEDISATHGIVGANAITDFDMPGFGPIIAYVSTIGLRMTNGVDSRALNTDVILKNYIHPAHWDKCILKAFPNQKWLVLYYVPKESNVGVLSKCFVYSYSEDHIKGGSTIVLSGNAPLTGPLPVTGPCDCYVVDASDIILDSSPQVATTDGRYIYIEDSSEDVTPVQTITSVDDATPIDRVNAPYIQTRDLFPAGFTQDSNIGSVYLMHETRGNQYVVTGVNSVQGSTTMTFNSGWGGNPLQIGDRVIHGGWDSPPSVLSLDDNDGTSITVSAPAVRAFTGSATFDTGVVLVRVNAAQFSEDMVPILSEYRSTSVGIGQAFLMDATANRFSVEIVKTENPNTGDLNDLKEDMSIIGIVYHAVSAGETNLHAN